MKLVKVVLAIAALASLLSSGAVAQEMKGKFAVTPQIGVVIPTGDFSSTEDDEPAGFAKAGFAGGVTGEYYITDQFAAGLTVFYNRFGRDTEDIEDASPGVNIDANWTILQAGVHGKYLFTEGKEVKPFGKAGVMLGKADQSLSASESGVSIDGETDVAMSLGIELALGILYEVSPDVFIFGEAGYNMLMTDGADADITVLNVTETGEVLINMNWIGIKGGVTFLFGN